MAKKVEQASRAVLRSALHTTYMLGISWVVMLLLGVLHGYFERVPPMGYWETYLLVVVWRLLLAAVLLNTVRPSK